MKQHHVTERCLKLLPKSRAVQHPPGSDFRRCITFHVYTMSLKTEEKRGKKMSSNCGWRNVVCAILFQSVLKIVS